MSQVLCLLRSITLFSSLHCQIKLCYTHFITNLQNCVSTVRIWTQLSGFHTLHRTILVILWLMRLYCLTSHRWGKASILLDYKWIPLGDVSSPCLTTPVYSQWTKAGPKQPWWSNVTLPPNPCFILAGRDTQLKLGQWDYLTETLQHELGDLWSACGPYFLLIPPKPHCSILTWHLWDTSVCFHKILSACLFCSCCLLVCWWFF